MIARSGNFFTANYEKFVLAAGVLALVGGAASYVLSLGVDAEAEAAAEVAAVDRLKPSESGVKAVDLGSYQASTRLVRTPTKLAEVSDEKANFLASERRVRCGKCRRAVLPSLAACPFCKAPMEVAKAVVLDADGDGLPDAWEKKCGLNPKDPADAAADADGDGFTNAEEFAAKTDPKDPKSHPDYLDSLTVQPQVAEKLMPFVFIAATKIPSGWRCQFFDAKQKDDYGRMGRTISALVGEEIGKSGFVLKGYEAKEEKRAIKGGKGMMKRVDVSVATVERKADGKTMKLVISANKREKPVPVDVAATLVYTRGQTKTFEVTPGSEITLNGSKYRIADVKSVEKGSAKGAEVTVVTVPGGKKRIFKSE